MKIHDIAWGDFLKRLDSDIEPQGSHRLAFIAGMLSTCLTIKQLSEVEATAFIDEVLNYSGDKREGDLPSLPIIETPDVERVEREG